MRQEEEASAGIYGLRKRRRGRVEDSDEPSPLEKLMAAAERSRKIIVFSGSGLSATSGMSTFSTKGGLYERAQKKFKLSDGKMLFTYSFFDKRRLEAQAFFADIYVEATHAHPAPGHHALSTLLEAGRLHRHYTLNIDGLAGMVGMDSWSPEGNPNGVTVEMHGNVRLLVCVECGATQAMDAVLAAQLKAQRPVPCAGCSHGAMRFKVMMYEDAESEAITPEEVLDVMEEDVKQCDLILWVGISFQQSASTEYFRKVRRWLQEAGRLEDVLQAVINPSDEALWNLMTATSNQGSDEILPQLADRLARLPRPSSSATPASAVAGDASRQQQAQQQPKQEDDQLPQLPLQQPLGMSPPLFHLPAAAAQQLQSLGVLLPLFQAPQQQPQQLFQLPAAGLPSPLFRLPTVPAQVQQQGGDSEQQQQGGLAAGGMHADLPAVQLDARQVLEAGAQVAAAVVAAALAEPPTCPLPGTELAALAQL